jgi:hypothetical protein
MARYVRNPGGTIHSVTDEHLEKYLSVTVEGGRVVLLPGWEEVDEKVARKEHPQEFGALDNSIVFNARERKDIEEREEFEARHRADG